MNLFHTRFTSLSALTIFTCLSLCAYAESGITSGSSALTYSDRKVAQIPNTNGEMLMLATVKGTLKSPGPMDGGSVVNEEIAQLFQGNGDQAGYYTVTTPDGSTVAKWDGKVITVMKEGNPMTTFKGKWEYVGGSGKYQNIKGKGDYNGYFTDKDAYVVDWKGNYSLDK